MDGVGLWISTFLHVLEAFISDDSKYILYYAYLQTEDIESAKAIKREIGNFAQTENKMSRNEEK